MPDTPGASDLDYEISRVIATHLREQAEAHLSIAESLTRRGRARALRRAQVHTELARRYALLANAEEDGRFNYAPPPFTTVSEREHFILASIAAGHSTAHVAAELRIGDDQLTRNFGHLMRKLGAQNRAHAIALAYQGGLLRIPLALAPIRIRTKAGADTPTMAGAGR